MADWSWVKKNEGYSISGFLFSFPCAVGGLLTLVDGTLTEQRNLSYRTIAFGGIALVLAILALIHKRQKRKYLAVIAIVLCLFGIALAVHALWLVYS